MRWVVTACVWLALSAAAQAHDLALSVLVLRELARGELAAHFERSQAIRDPGAAHLLLRPVFPEHCRFEPPRLHCGAKGLSGSLGFEGLGELSSAALIRVERRSGQVDTYAFSAARPRLLVRADGPQLGRVETSLSFIGVGVEHIVLGFDHLAFVLGLLWLVRGVRALVGTISAFTLGHGVSLSAAALGITSVPRAPVEAAIALSVAFVALELVRREQGRAPGLAARAPYAVAAGLGLLHGLGFANALRELAVEPDALPSALVGFNLGVELGQLAFVAAVLSLRRLLPTWLHQALPGLRLAAPYALGALAMYWFFSRLAELLHPVAA